MEFKLDIDGDASAYEMAGWLQSNLVAMCLDRPDLKSGRILIKKRSLGWYIELIAYGGQTVLASDAGGTTLEATADRAIQKFSKQRYRHPGGMGGGTGHA